MRKSTTCGKFSSYSNFKKRCSQGENIHYHVQCENCDLQIFPVRRIAQLLPSVTYKCDYEIQDQFFQLIE